MRRKRGRGAIIAVFVIAVIVFGVIWEAWSTFTDVFLPPSNTSKQITLVIQEGENTQQIANDLVDKGLVRNALAFSIWARVKGLDRSLEAGAYILSPNMTIDQIITRLEKGQPDEKRLVVVDGFRLEQIALKAADIGLTHFNKNDFLNYTKHPAKFPDVGKYPILKNLNSMEGLLFPDTYLVPVNYDTVKTIDMMLDEFTQIIQQNKLVDLAKKYQMNEYQMIILASIVQREAGNTEDMGLIAGIYWNRLFKQNDETNGRLEADPTVEYARDTDNPPKDGKYWSPLGNDGTGQTVAPQNKWNTYNFAGLPPTPISSPNVYALKAAASPSATKCYFFLSNPKNGRVVCAATYNEFLNLQQQYLH